MVSGGPNGGPQYNPNNISGIGGDGQSGKKAQKAMQLRPSGGGEYGATKALTQQIQQGGNVKTTAPAVANMSIPQPSLSPLTGITEPSARPQEDITTGTLANPPGMTTPGPEALSAPGGGMQDMNFKRNIEAYYPVIAYISGRSDTSEDTRQILNTLMRAI